MLIAHSLEGAASGLGVNGPSALTAGGSDPVLAEADASLPADTDALALDPQLPDDSGGGSSSPPGMLYQELATATLVEVGPPAEDLSVPLVVDTFAAHGLVVAFRWDEGRLGGAGLWAERGNYSTRTIV